jgi:hypothetical protein
MAMASQVVAMICEIDARMSAVKVGLVSCLYGRVNAETPPLRGGVSDAAGEPDDYLLSHG